MAGQADCGNNLACASRLVFKLPFEIENTPGKRIR
jgi:hypothetical protein